LQLVLLAMPIFFFNVRRGEEAGYSSEGAEFADHGVAWKEMTGVCGGLIGDISRKRRMADGAARRIQETGRPDSPDRADPAGQRL